MVPSPRQRQPRDEMEDMEGLKPSGPTGPSGFESRRGYQLDDVVKAVEAFEETGREPQYIIVDGVTYLNIWNTVREFPWKHTGNPNLTPRTAELMQIQLVVMPTDGIPMIKVVGGVHEEALRNA